MTTRLSRKAERHDRAKKQFDEISKVLETKMCYRTRGTSLGELLLNLLKDNGYRVRYVESQCNHTCGKKCQTRKCLCRCPDYPDHYSTDLCNCNNGWLCSHKCEDLVCYFGSWILIDKT
jgi:hypothetical protein